MNKTENHYPPKILIIINNNNNLITPLKIIIIINNQLTVFLLKDLVKILFQKILQKIESVKFNFQKKKKKF